MPHKLLLLLGYIMGNLMYLLPNSSKKITETNLQLCFPEKNSKEISYLTKKSLVETSKIIFELGKCWFTYRKIGVQAITEVEGLNLVEESLERGSGVILFAPHLGNIEILLNFLAEKFNCYIPYTPAKIDALERIMKESREQMGANMVTTSISGIRSMLKALKKGKVVVMASDQVPDKRSGLICDFFGNEALTVSLISRLSKRTKSSCHLVYCVRQKRSSGFKIVFEKKLDSMNELDEKEGSNLMNRELEKCIMKFPEQYAWEYKRFKHSTFKNPY